MTSHGFGWRVSAVLAVVWMLMPAAAHGYVGPGGVITALGVVLGLLAAVAISVVGFLWFPAKRLWLWLRRIRKKKAGPPATAPPERVGE